jgi:MraZ protein
MYPAHIDDKGRLKLPAAFRDYFGRLQNHTLFATTLDNRVAHIYPGDEWTHLEQKLDSANSAAADDILFLAYHLGGDVTVDAQSRILIPPELRRSLKIENQAVKLMFLRGVLHVYSETEYDQRLLQAKDNQAEKVANLRQEGLK